MILNAKHSTRQPVCKRDKAEGGEEETPQTIVYQMKLQNNQANQNTQIQKISLQGGEKKVSKEDLIHNCSEAMQVKLLLL